MSTKPIDHDDWDQLHKAWSVRVEAMSPRLEAEAIAARQEREGNMEPVFIPEEETRRIERADAMETAVFNRALIRLMAGARDAALALDVTNEEADQFDQVRHWLFDQHQNGLEPETQSQLLEILS
jgi:hypothetical protein